MTKIRIDQETQTQWAWSDQEQDARKATIPVELGVAKDTMSPYKKDKLPGEQGKLSSEIEGLCEAFLVSNTQSLEREQIAIGEVDVYRKCNKTLDANRVCVKERLSDAEAKEGRTSKLSTALTVTSCILGVITLGALFVGTAGIGAAIAGAAALATGVASIAGGITQAFQTKYSAEAGHLKSEVTQIRHQRSLNQQQQQRNMEHAKMASESRSTILSQLTQLIQNFMRAAHLK